MSTDFLMPPHDAPFKAKDVRDLYRKGTWAYALGKPAWTHPQYKKAVEIARKGRKFKGCAQRPFNPWWIRNWSDVCAVLDGCYMDERRGMEAVEWEQMLHHFEDVFAGKPFILSDWQKWDIEMPIFGWTRPDGTRRYRRTLEFEPKKQGKTTRCAARSVYMTGPIGTQGAESYTASTSQQQSYKMFRAGVEMLKRSPDVRDDFEIIESRYRIVHPATASFWRALPEVPDSTEGMNVFFLAKDEVHVWKDRRQYDSFKYAGAARTEPLDSTISTAGEYDPASIGQEEFDYGKAVAFAENGAEADWSIHAFICELTKAEEEYWHEPRMAIKTNPNIGITVKLEEDQERCVEVKQRPSMLNNFLRYRRNVWVQALQVWIPKDKWAACAAEYTEDDLEGLVCYPGIDASLRDDLSAVCLAFPPQGELKKWRIWPYFWIPEETIAQHDEQNHGWYSMWIKGGHVLKTPGNTIDQEFIRHKLHECRDRFNLRTIGADQRYCGKLLQDLENDGFDAGPFGQSFADMNEPIVKVESLIEDGMIEHPDNPALNWQMANAHVRENPDGLKKVAKASKQTGKAGGVKRFKVDGVIAMIEAVGTAQLDETPIEISYEVIWGT